MNGLTKTKIVKPKRPCMLCGKLFVPIRCDKRVCTKKCYDHFYNLQYAIIRRNDPFSLVNNSGKEFCIWFLSQLSIARNGSEFSIAKFEKANFNFQAFSRRFESPINSGHFVLEFGRFEVTRIDSEKIMVKLK